MSQPVVELKQVSKSFQHYHHLGGSFKDFIFRFPHSLRRFRFDTYQALQNIHLAIEPGESVGVIGHNGAGKSTLLSLVAGVIAPSQGEVQVRERPFPLLALGAGFHPDLDGKENVVLNAMLLGASRSLIRSRVDTIIRFAELEPFADQPVRTYSSGMLARLGFSVIAHLEPRLLLVDEILGVGDMRFKAKCQDTLERFRRKGCTTLLVSHNLTELVDSCNRMIWIKQGKLQQEGKPADVVRAYELDERARLPKSAADVSRHSSTSERKTLSAGGA